MIPPSRLRLSLESRQALTFAPLAWLKLQFFCHRGASEIGGFGISAEEDLLYIEDFVTVRQQVTAVTVCFDDAAVADWFDRCVDHGLAPARFARVWLHTHPGASVTPSGTDEETFARVFSRCDWSILFILGRSGRTYARLAFAAGPGGELLLPVQVDWSGWPDVLASRSGMLEAQVEQWRQEYAANIQLPAELASLGMPMPLKEQLGDTGWWDWERPPTALDDLLSSLVRKEKQT